jgi:hypothetical protein
MHSAHAALQIMPRNNHQQCIQVVESTKALPSELSAAKIDHAVPHEKTIYIDARQCYSVVGS